MPRRKRPAYGMEACGMVEDCGGTPAFVVALQTCRSTRKTPAPSANVSDGGCIARTRYQGQTNEGAHEQSGLGACVQQIVALRLV